jgi:hypothetical protein
MSSCMAQPIATEQQVPGTFRLARRLAPAIVAGCAGLGIIILLAALLLWFHYGTAVFFEMIASGIAACF